MRRDVQEIFRNTPHEKQVMMFSATLSKDIRPVCKKFMQDVITTNYYGILTFITTIGHYNRYLYLFLTFYSLLISAALVPFLYFRTVRTWGFKVLGEKLKSIS
jgi:hypothetical protein